MALLSPHCRPGCRGCETGGTGLILCLVYGSGLICTHENPYPQTPKHLNPSVIFQDVVSEIFSLPLVHIWKICTWSSGSSSQFSHRDCTEDTSEAVPGPWDTDQPVLTLSLRTEQFLPPHSPKLLLMENGGWAAARGRGAACLQLSPRHSVWMWN